MKENRIIKILTFLMISLCIVNCCFTYTILHYKSKDNLQQELILLQRKNLKKYKELIDIQSENLKKYNDLVGEQFDTIKENEFIEIIEYYF